MEKEFTGPRSHKGWETVPYTTAGESSVGVVTKLRVGCPEESWLDPVQRQHIYTLLKAPRPDAVPAQPPMKWEQDTFPLG